MANESVTSLKNQMLEKTTSSCQVAIEKWCVIVTKMGLPADIKQTWVDSFTSQIDSVLDEMLDDVNNSYDNLLDSIETLLKEASVLCNTLQIKIPPYGEQLLNLYEEKKLLTQKIKEYKELIIEKEKEILNLQKRQNEVCDALGRAPRDIPKSPLPSDEFIAAFKDYLDELEMEKFERLEQFLKIKCSLQKLSKELDYEPDLDFQKTVLGSDDSMFLVTDENMAYLQEFYDSLLQQQEDIKEKIINEKERIKYLWEVLSEDRQYCDSFLEKCTGNNAKTLSLLKVEHKRCEELKRANIKTFVERYRNQLEELWNKCHFTDEQREQFDHFNDDLYTEDLLSLFDVEIKKLQKYYDANREILTLMERYEELWSKRLEIENREKTPGRFQNRGGQLLREEKQRNATQKQIGKIEEKLYNLAETYEMVNKTPFLSWGTAIQNIILAKHESYEQEKKIKLSELKQKRDKTLTPAKSMPNLMRSASSHTLRQPVSTASKRKLITTPVLSSKRKCIFPEQNHGVLQSIPKIMLNGQYPGPSRYSRERAKRLKKCIRLSQRHQKTNENNSSISLEYDSFEDELNTNKENCRSTHFIINDEELAHPLPSTPRRPVLTVCNTPCTKTSKTPRPGTSATPLKGTAQKPPKSPRTASKLTAAPPLKLLF